MSEKITAGKIKDLREKTGAGMMNCKNALKETKGDIQEAIDWLRSKGLSMAAKKSGRVASEGLVAVALSDDKKTGILLEVNSETDFVARNSEFQEFINNVANIVLTNHSSLKGKTLEDLLAKKYDESLSVNDKLVQLIASIGENLYIRRFEILTTKDGYIFGYVHNKISTTLGLRGVIIEVDFAGDINTSVAQQIAMHIAATSPISLSLDDLSAEVIERERNIQVQLAKESGKPDNVIEKMIDGRLKKFYKEVCLLEQSFVIDPDKTIFQVCDNNKMNVSAYRHFVVGEGIEKKEENFADEVAKMVS